MNEFYQRGYCGIDKMGRPINVVRAGRINATGMYSLMTEEEYWKFIY